MSYLSDHIMRDRAAAARAVTGAAQLLIGLREVTEAASAYVAAADETRKRHERERQEAIELANHEFPDDDNSDVVRYIRGKRRLLGILPGRLEPMPTNTMRRWLRVESARRMHMKSYGFTLTMESWVVEFPLHKTAERLLVAAAIAEESMVLDIGSKEFSIVEWHHNKTHAQLETK